MGKMKELFIEEQQRIEHTENNLMDADYQYEQHLEKTKENPQNLLNPLEINELQ